MQLSGRLILQVIAETMFREEEKSDDRKKKGEYGFCSVDFYKLFSDRYTYTNLSVLIPCLTMVLVNTSMYINEKYPISAKNYHIAFSLT